jgi:hypothetical protein
MLHKRVALFARCVLLVFGVASTARSQVSDSALKALIRRIDSGLTVVPRVCIPPSGFPAAEGAVIATCSISDVPEPTVESSPIWSAAAIMAPPPPPLRTCNATVRDVWVCDPSIPDSVVLQRSFCYGPCPAYRVSIDRFGKVRFHSLSPNDTARYASAQINRYMWRRYMSQMISPSSPDGLLQFPDNIASNEAYCPGGPPPDFQWVTVSVFLPSRTKIVQDYLGCSWAPEALRDFERWFDKKAGSKKWLRPPHFSR